MGRKITDTSKIRPAAHTAWDDLQAALTDTIPDWDGDDRYTTDTLSPDDRTELATICAACPILDPCSTYALTEKPLGGWWPGNNLTTRKTRAA